MKIFTFRGRGISRPIINSINSALKELGHEVKCIDGQELKGQAPSAKIIEDLIAEIKRFNPELALFYGVYGIIPVETPQGKTTLFDILKIPYVSLFFDDPFISFPIYSQYRDSPFYHITVFDRVYLDRLLSLGFKKVHHLPIGVDPSIFKKMELDKASYERYHTRLSFVGHIFPKEEFEEERISWNPFLNKIIDETVKIKMRNFHLPVPAILSEIIKTIGGKGQKTLEDFLQTRSSSYFLCQIYKEIDSLYRKELINALPIPIDLYGGEGFISDKTRMRGGIDYENELPRLYSATEINLNITTSQSITSPTQRVFDVSACGGFVLTDYRPGIEEWYRLGEEIICYHTPEELRDLINYYLDHPEERQAIAERAYLRTIREHTYKERMKQVIKACANG